MRLALKMEGLMYEKTSRLKLTAVAVLVLVLLVACGDKESGHNDRVISINGSIAFPNTRTVAVETQGALGRLAVEEGQAVTVGQPLAYMDRATMKALEGALAQAQVDVSMAREVLASTLAPPSPLEVAQAEARVANAEEALRTAEEDLLALLRPTDHDVAIAESVRADTILKIDALRDEIGSLIGGPDEKELEHLQFQARLDQIVLENALRGRSLTVEEWGCQDWRGLWRSRRGRRGVQSVLLDVAGRRSPGRRRQPAP